MTQIDDFKEYIKFALENALIDACPVDKGSLKGSVNVELDGDNLTVSMLEYGLYLDQGTGLYGPLRKKYEIKPKTKKALSFDMNGSDVVVKKVMHPGIKPYPWIRNTFFHKFPQIVQEAADETLEGADVEVAFE